MIDVLAYFNFIVGVIAFFWIAGELHSFSRLFSLTSKEMNEMWERIKKLEGSKK